jgi:peptide chain release factor 1
VHSSTVTVAVLGEGACENKFSQRQPDDFEITFFSGTGPGGQNRNKCQASARVKHLPTGIVRSAQTRSRENSVRLAMAALAEDLDRAADQSKTSQVQQVRRDQVGTGMRGDKRRTYRFQDGLAHDHLTSRSAPLDRVMAGGLDALWPRPQQGE